MRYVVMCTIAGKMEKLAEKQSMDDALDLIQTMEGFDDAIGVRVIDEYKVKIKREG